MQKQEPCPGGAVPALPVPGRGAGRGAGWSGAFCARAAQGKICKCYINMQKEGFGSTRPRPGCAPSRHEVGQQRLLQGRGTKQPREAGESGLRF